jgi:xanthine phosphoribosyltransferase
MPAFSLRARGTEPGRVTADTLPEHIVSWNDIHRFGLLLAEAAAASGPFDGLLAVSRGGLVPATIVAKALGLTAIDVIAVSSYSGRRRGEARVLKEPVFGADGRWLVVDDIADSGETLKLVRARYPDAVIATVFAKPAGRPLVDHFAAEVAQDVWVEFPWDRPPDGSYL